MPNITRPCDVAQYAADLARACARRCFEPAAEYQRRTAGPLAALDRWIERAVPVRRIDGTTASIKELCECRRLFERCGADLPRRNRHPRFLN
jgi:hypothetical protein